MTTTPLLKHFNRSRALFTIAFAFGFVAIGIVGEANTSQTLAADDAAAAKRDTKPTFKAAPSNPLSRRPANPLSKKSPWQGTFQSDGLTITLKHVKGAFVGEITSNGKPMPATAKLESSTMVGTFTFEKHPSHLLPVWMATRWP